jgi:hypothetical protein
MVETHYSKSGRTAATAAAPAGSAEGAAAAAAAGSANDGGFAPTAFVCQNFTCQAPTGDAGKVYELLSKQGEGVVKLQPVKL